MTQQIEFAYKSLRIEKGQPLGRGSYGAVYKAKCDQLPCAAKVLHPTILDPTDPGAGKVMTKFKQECKFLGSILHPRIVQYLGMTTDPESRLPVLLMELLDESLTKMLERSQQSLAYCVQVDICHDIALAVAYLHSNDIIHRDLSSNNVLMIAGRRAKVTDFGMSKLAAATPTKTPLTMCPGTSVYMPPEALREPPRHTKKLDCFSEGVIMIQVCTRLWPEPGPRTQLIQDFRSPTGSTEMPVLETERRKKHIDLVDPTHTLLPIAVDCLKYQVDDRPSSEELCQRLTSLKETKEYRESAEQLKEGEGGTCEHETKRQVHELREKEKKNAQKIRQQQEEIKKRDDQIKLQAKRLKEKEEEIRQQKKELQGKLASHERNIHVLNKQLEQQERVMKEIQQTNIALQRQVEEMEQQDKVPSRQKHDLLSQQHHVYENKSLLQLPPPLPPKPAPAERKQKTTGKGSQTSLLAVQKVNTPRASPQHSSYARNYVYLNLRMKKAELKWRDGGRAPVEMVRGDAVTNGNEAYFANYGGEICSYNSVTNRWKGLPKCPYQGSSLAIVNGTLTSIGGFEGGIIRSPKNQLFSLSSDKSSTTGDGWTVQFPPMPTRRCNTAAITTEDKLIVAGGESGTTYMQRLTTVEVMDTKAPVVWSTVASLPHPYSSTSAAICGDDLYVLGGLDESKQTTSVLTCSLTELLLSSRETTSVWYRTADSAKYYSTCAAVNGELVAVGGCDEEGDADAGVYKYKSATNSWDLIGKMPTARYQCLVAVLESRKMMVVGGSEHLTPTDTVEITDV